jgi:hypothetical protein
MNLRLKNFADLFFSQKARKKFPNRFWCDAVAGESECGQINIAVLTLI